MLPDMRNLSTEEQSELMQNFLLYAGSEFQNIISQIPESDPNFPEELVYPDTYGAEQIFLSSFITPEMRDDFTLIAKDFYHHEFENISKYEDVEYLSIDTGDDWPGRMFERFTLSLMFNAYKSGSEYAKALFLHLYKTYYKKEYKQLKKFTFLSLTELLSLGKPNDMHYLYIENWSRILCISNMLGLKITRSCNSIYMALNIQADNIEKAVKRDAIDFDDEEYESCFNEIESFDLKKLHNLERKANKFISNVLKWYGYASEYVDFCDSYEESLEDRLTNTLLLLKRTYPSKSFTEKEIVFYSEIFHCVGALISGSDWLSETLPVMAYGKEAIYNYDDYTTKFNPDEIKLNEKPKEINVIDKTKKKSDMSEETNAVFKEEIEALRRKVHKLESDNNSLRSELIEKRKLDEETKALKKGLENANKELAALRDFAYKQTKEEIAESRITIDQMKQELAKHRIIIIGGHTNWVAKMKEQFPGWVFINPDAGSSVDVSVVNKADHVYFFTDTISHSKYYQFMNVVRERKIDFGYVHGVNIDNTIEYIYKDLNDE